MKLREGSLFSGYNGLGMAVSEVFGSEPAWFSEIEPGPSKILAHHWPEVPNLGDLTAIDWDAVEPIDILSGGFPCQDVSAAGKRAGLHPDTRSGLWNHMAYAISKLRPRYVVAENVRGLLSAEAHSDVEPCPWCLGEGSGEPDLRALGAVLGDLAELGYDAQWCGLRAADVGAPHGRYRIFVLATDAQCERHEQALRPAAGEAPRPRSLDTTDGRRGVRVATDTDNAGRQQHGRPVAVRPQLAAIEHGGDLATDAGNNGRQGRTELDRWPLGGIEASLGDDADGCADTAADAASERHGDTWTPSLGGVPTTTVGGDPAALADADSGDRNWRPTAGQQGQTGSATGDAVLDWGQYGPAIERWERVLGRVAPAPTEPGAKGGQRLAPRFVEWMQGLPAGHVTDVPGVNRNAQLKALGNGVVPQQAAAALRHLVGAA